MPLSDIYQISERMLDSARSQTSTEAFFGPEAGLVELVWESGQVKSRRRCIRTRQDEAFPSVAAAVKRQKGSETDSHDFSVRGINRDDNAVPWFSCPAEEDDESLQRGYYSGLFPELPDVLTANHSMPSLEQGQSRSSIAFGFDQEEDEPGGVLGKDEECDLQKNMTRSEGGGSAGSSSTCPVYSIMNTLNGAALPAYPNSVMEQSTGLPQMERKPSENEESEGRSDDAECESVGMKKGAGPARSSGSRRSRAAEVHNLSERRRRDRINEKMRALQELIPNCNKVDKASMLDEAIEYLKTLQLQVQIMSMGAGYYVPSPQLMFQSGLQPVQAMQMSCLPHVRFGMGFGMRPLEAANGLLPPLPTFHSTTQGQGGLFYDPNPSDYPRPGGISAHGVPLPVSQSIYTPNSSLVHNARFSLNTIPDQFHSSHT